MCVVEYEIFNAHEDILTLQYLMNIFKERLLMLSCEDS